ncbi:hypothetical protein B0H13DRAFT_1891855 [Mycena leptocephala]|nr:hypothetical protein B0H13DRAFT_1891855 [Mycena leptocephala]
MPKSIQTSAKVQQEKKAKEDQQRQAKEKRHQSITNAATIENRITKEENVRNQNANRPPPTELKKQLRPRTEKPALMDNKEGNAQGIVDPYSDGRGSSDYYQPNPDEQLPSESDDELMDASEKEGIKPTKSGRTKKAPKGSIRRDFDAERFRQGGSVAEGKIKAPPVEQVLPPCCPIHLLTCRRSKPRKKPKKANFGGIQSDWDRGRTFVTWSVHSPTRSRCEASSDGDIMPPGSDSSAIGGIPSDVDDGDEGAYAATNTQSVKLARAKHREKPPSEICLQFGEISFLLSKEGQFRAIRANILQFPWLGPYPHLW